MCTWFYADYKSLENYITRAQKSPLANENMLTMSRSTAMTGEIRPTDVAAVIASGRSGNPLFHIIICGQSICYFRLMNGIQGKNICLAPIYCQLSRME